MTDPAEARRIVREGYDRASQAYRGDDADLEMSGYGHWLRRLAARVPDGARVLDLGCGNGVPATREMAKRWAVTGVDLSPVQVERARALVPGARFVCADMTEAEFADASFDAVTALYSIINVPVEDQPALLARIARWLVPGGWLLAVLGRDPWTGLEPDFRGSGLPMYWSYADVHRYRRWLAEAGFTIAEEGRQPPKGEPGFAVMLARRAGGDPLRD
jgi:SAM-dependent methyltransferase